MTDTHPRQWPIAMSNQNPEFETVTDPIEVIARAICWDNCQACSSENHCFECQDRNVLDGRFGEEANSVIAALNAAGLVVVPKEPTEAMRWAGSKAKNAHVIAGGHRANPSEIYKAMIGKAGK